MHLSCPLQDRVPDPVAYDLALRDRRRAGECGAPTGCGEISVGSSRGAGFAVAPDIVLTALHVVGKIVGGALQLHDPAIRIYAAVVDDADGGVRTLVAICTARDVVDHEAVLDWLAIRVDPEAFAGARGRVDRRACVRTAQPAISRPRCRARRALRRGRVTSVADAGMNTIR